MPWAGISGREQLGEKITPQFAVKLDSEPGKAKRQAHYKLMVVRRGLIKSPVGK